MMHKHECPTQRGELTCTCSEAGLTHYDSPQGDKSTLVIPKDGHQREAFECLALRDRLICSECSEYQHCMCLGAGTQGVEY